MEYISAPVIDRLLSKINAALNKNYQKLDLVISPPELRRDGEDDRDTTITIAGAPGAEEVDLTINYRRRDLSRDIPAALNYFPIDINADEVVIVDNICAEWSVRAGLELTPNDIELEFDSTDYILDSNQLVVRARESSYAVVGSTIITCGAATGGGGGGAWMLNVDDWSDPSIYYNGQLLELNNLNRSIDVDEGSQRVGVLDGPFFARSNQFTLYEDVEGVLSNTTTLYLDPPFNPSNSPYGFSVDGYTCTLDFGLNHIDPVTSGVVTLLTTEQITHPDLPDGAGGQQGYACVDGDTIGLNLVASHYGTEEVKYYYKVLYRPAEVAENQLSFSPLFEMGTGDYGTVYRGDPSREYRLECFISDRGPGGTRTGALLEVRKEDGDQPGALVKSDGTTMNAVVHQLTANGKVCTSPRYFYYEDSGLVCIFDTLTNQVIETGIAVEWSGTPDHVRVDVVNRQLYIRYPRVDV